MLERDFQKDLVKQLRKKYPDAIVFKTDSKQVQGIPDLLILKDATWALLECKASATANKRPNQDLYVERFNNMSFSRFIYPENKDEVLRELEQMFQSRKGIKK